MQFNLDPEQKELKSTARRVAEEELAENAFTYQGEYPIENASILSDAGLLGISLPEKYGGRGMTPLEVLMVQEEIGRICPDTAHLISHSSMGSPSAINHLGTEEQKEKYLYDVCEGNNIITVAISEAEAGTAASEMQTTAKDDGDDIIINGEKKWPGRPKASKAYLVYTRFEEGIGAVLVDRDNPGLEQVETYTNMYGGTQSRIQFSNCRVNKDQVLVRGENAFVKLLKEFNTERCHNAMMSVSLARSAFEKSLEYAQEREQFGGPIGENQAISHKLADMAMKIEAARLLVFQATTSATGEGNDGVKSRAQTSIAKVFANKMGEEVANDAVQIHGAKGYMQGHPVEYIYRKIRGRKIAGGTAEIHRDGIADVLYDHGYNPY